MKASIDANVILDVLQKREPHFEDSLKIWKLCETERVEGCVSTLTFANLIYVMRKELQPQRIAAVFNATSLIFHFVALDVADLVVAVEKKWDDFEDAVQVATAERLHADFIITRNTKDFVRSPIPAVAPSEFLSLL